ncbi:MAG: peptide deformylase [Candidatus Omnitrophota bacterium]
MAVLKVLEYPDRILLTKARPLARITEEDRRLFRDMIETMHAEQGVGLAANQIGVLKQIFVACSDQVKGNEIVLINPQIVKKRGSVKEFEGCLSVPDCYEPVRRFKKVTLRAKTADFKDIEVEAQGLLARVFQHETDHLNGILFIERLGILKSRLAKRKLNKQLKARARAR